MGEAHDIVTGQYLETYESSTLSHPSSLSSFLILFALLCLCFLIGLFPSDFFTKIFYAVIFFLMNAEHVHAILFCANSSLILIPFHICFELLYVTMICMADTI